MSSIDLRSSASRSSVEGDADNFPLVSGDCPWLPLFCSGRIWKLSIDNRQGEAGLNRELLHGRVPLADPADIEVPFQNLPIVGKC